MNKSSFKGCFCSKEVVGQNNINKIIPELVSGSSTQAVTKQQALKTLKRVQGLSNFTTAHGFTLIELLVVVLIIGILAAVAVPQYQIAVAKSRIGAILPTVSTLHQAAETYYLANGSYTTSIHNLDVSIPCTESLRESDNMPFWTCGNDLLLQASETGIWANYCPNHNASYEDCAAYRDLQIGYNYYYTTGNGKGNMICIVLNNSTFGEKLCKHLGKSYGSVYNMN